MWKTVTLGASCKMYQPKIISTKEMVADGEYVVFEQTELSENIIKNNHAEPQLLVTCRGATCGAVNISEPFRLTVMLWFNLTQRKFLKYMENLGAY